MARKSHSGAKKSTKSSKRSADADLARELAALGKQVSEAIAAVAASPEVKEIRAEITSSIERVGNKVVDAVNSARESKKQDEIREQLDRVKQHGAEAGKKVRDNLASGLREIGDELARLAQRLRER